MKLSAIQKRHDDLFIRGDGVDMRTIPRVKHPLTKKLHFNHGTWPVDSRFKTSKKGK